MATAAATRQVFQLKVQLDEIEPSIWRRIHIWENTNLPALHQILQALFQWEDSHLHQFQRGDDRWAVPDPEDVAFGMKIQNERSVLVSRLVKTVGDKFTYLYDFGDDWVHLIELEAILPAEPGTVYPRCIEGARNGPPEDSGGAYGYMEYQKVMANKKSSRHKEMLEWRGPFDPEEFSVAEMDRRMRGGTR